MGSASAILILVFWGPSTSTPLSVEPNPEPRFRTACTWLPRNRLSHLPARFQLATLGSQNSRAVLRRPTRAVGDTDAPQEPHLLRCASGRPNPDIEQFKRGACP